MQIGLAAGALALSILFQNCSGGFETYKEAGQASATANEVFTCGATLQETFAKTYYPTLKSACVACHVPNGFAPSAFSASDLAAAFAGFQTATQAKIMANGINPAHGGGAGGDKNKAALTDAQNKYDVCKAAQAPAPTGLAARTAPVTLAATATAKIITINLDSQLELGSANFGGAQLLISVRTSTVGALPVYVFSNPSLKTGTSAVQIKGIKFKINGVTDPAWTAFSQIDKTINPNTNPQNGTTLNGNLAVGNGTMGVAAIAATDTLQIEFTTLKVP